MHITSSTSPNMPRTRLQIANGDVLTEGAAGVMGSIRA
jgi:hypothetical protein